MPANWKNNALGYMLDSLLNTALQHDTVIPKGLNLVLEHIYRIQIRFLLFLHHHL